MRVNARQVRRWLIVAAFGLAFTGPALVAAALVVRLAGLDGSDWSTWLGLTAIVAALTGVAGALSGPLVSRVEAFLERRLSGSADEHARNGDDRHVSL